MSSSRPTTRLFAKSVQKSREESASSTPRPSLESIENLSPLRGFTSAENTQLVSGSPGENIELKNNEENAEIMSQNGDTPAGGDRGSSEISPETEERLVARLTESLSQMLEARMPAFPQDMPPRSSRGRRSHRGRNRVINNNPQRNFATTSAASGEGATQAIINPEQSEGYGHQAGRSSGDFPDINEVIQQPQLHTSGYSKRLEMHRWNVQFTGDGTGLYIDEFLKRVEYIAIAQNYTFAEVARNLYMFLRGLAASWYFQWVPKHPNASWSSMKKALEDHFRTAETDCDLEHQLMNRMQRPNETFDQFYNALAELNCRMQNGRSDRDLIEIMKRNASGKLTVFIHSSMTTILPEFLKQCRRAEKAVLKIETQRRSAYQARVSEVSLVEEVLGTGDEVEDHVETLAVAVEGPKRTPPDHSRLSCFDCKEVGHMAINCMRKSNRIFCYRCGLDDYVVSNCPNCKGKNSKKSGAAGSPAN